MPYIFIFLLLSYKEIKTDVHTIDVQVETFLHKNDVKVNLE